MKYEGSIEYIVESINNLGTFINEDGKKKSIIYKLDLENIENNREWKEYIKGIQLLMELDILSTPNITINKKRRYDLEEGSSGEAHLIFTITNILSKIEPGSLIFIDEPEIRLHPNWQIKYVNALKNILEEYMGCHIITETHSYFMISDINKDTSSLITIKNIKGNTEIKLYEEDTYGWSTENILYNVFEVLTNLLIGDFIAYSNNEMQKPDGDKLRFTFSGSVYFNRMKETGFYTTDSKVVSERVKKASLEGIYNKKIVK